MIQVGSLVDGKYKVLNEIGHGGMSTVYLAINERANKTWAIKEVRKNGTTDYDTVRQGLIAETNILKKLSHPRLPSIIDVIDDGDSFIIVMDYIEGTDLSKRLKNGPQPWRDVVEWGKQLCDVLAYLHAQNPPIIYRDMKPANVMLKPDGSVMLMDFGTAREYKSNRAGDDTTCLGTKGYAAPEQYGGQGQTDGRTDIYCLGATMYHLVTGVGPLQPPYNGMVPIRQINPKLPRGLESIILKCTRDNKNERYQDCAELMYDLENIDKISSAYINKQKAKRNRFFISAAATLLFAAAGIGCGIAANQTSNAAYETQIKAALNEFDNSALSAADISYQDIESGLKEAISIIPSDKRAWIYLSRLYRSDELITEKERQTMVELRNLYGRELEKSDSDYAQYCLEWGTDMFFFYDTDESAEIGSGHPEKAVDFLSVVVGDRNDSSKYSKRLVNDREDTLTDKSMMQIKSSDEADAQARYQVAIDMQEIAKGSSSLGKKGSANSALNADEYTYADYFEDLSTLMNDDEMLTRGDIGLSNKYFVCSIYNNVISAISLHMNEMYAAGVSVDQLDTIIQLVEKKSGEISAVESIEPLLANIQTQTMNASHKLDALR